MEQTHTIDKADFLSIAQQAKNTIADAKQQEVILANFQRQSLPTRKTEIWRHTNIQALLEKNYILQQNKEAKADLLHKAVHIEANTLVFVNGYLHSDLCNISEHEIIIQSLSEAKTQHPEIIANYFAKTNLSKRNAFAALESAFSENGALVFIPKNKQAEKTTHLIFINTKTEKSELIQHHNIFVAEKGSSAKIIVSQVSEGENQHFENAGFEIFVQQNAHLEVNFVLNSTENTKILNTIAVQQAADSRYEQNSFSLQAAFIRNDIEVELQGQNTESNLHGIYIPRLKQHFDQNILIKHLVPNGRSNQTFKGIMNNEASAVFMSKVLVAKNAQKTNANQTNRNILLSKRTRVNSKPQLEIYADDVICSHGSTTGQLDEEALFYMQARGISYETAQKLLLYAFVGDVLEQISIPELKEYVNTELHKRFDN